MSGFAIGLAILFLMAAGFVWGRVGLGWARTGYWRSFTLDDFYALLFSREMSSGGGPFDYIIGLFGGIDLGIIFTVIGIAIYVLAARKLSE